MSDEVGSTSRRLDAIAEIFSRGILRCFSRGEPEPKPPSVSQNFEIRGSRVVSEKPYVVEVQCGFTKQKRKPKPAPPKPEGRLPHITLQLARAHQMQKLLDEGKVNSRRELAKRLRLSPARVTQLLDLLFLAPDLQEKLLFLPPTTKARDTIAERDVRLIAGVPAWTEQRALWDDLHSGTRVRLLLDDKATKVTKQRWHPTQQVSHTRRGTVLSMRTRPTTELARRILACGRGVEVLAPESLRKQVAYELRGAASRYREK